MFTKDEVNSDYGIRQDIAAVRNYGEVDFFIVKMTEALSGDFAETRNVATVRIGSGERILCSVPGAHTAEGGSAVIKSGAVFLHQSGVGGWLRAQIL